MKRSRRKQTKRPQVKGRILFHPQPVLDELGPNQQLFGFVVVADTPEWEAMMADGWAYIDERVSTIPWIRLAREDMHLVPFVSFEHKEAAYWVGVICEIDKEAVGRLAETERSLASLVGEGGNRGQVND